MTDPAPAYPRVLDELVPEVCHVVEQYANNPIEADHGRLKARTRGHAFVQSLESDLARRPSPP
jgi:transposase-like protein